MDGIEKLQNNEFNQTAAQHLNTYITFLNDCHKIPFHMYADKVSKILKWSNLTGPEKLKLFKAIKIPELFPSLSKCKRYSNTLGHIQKFYGQAKTWMNKKSKILWKRLQVG